MAAPRGGQVGVELAQGEQVLFGAQISSDPEAYFCVTTFRVAKSETGKAPEWLPIGSVSSAKASKSSLSILTRGPRELHVSFHQADKPNEQSSRAAHAIRQMIVESDAILRAKALCTSAELKDGWNIYDARAEFARQGLPSYLRIYDQTEGYKLCNSYPRFLVVPQNVGDDVIQGSAAFRSSGRLPVVTWVHPRTRAVMARSAQPLAGLRNQTSEMDEQLVEALMMGGGNDTSGCDAEALSVTGLSAALPPTSPKETHGGSTFNSTINGTRKSSSPTKSEDRNSVHQFVAGVWSNIFAVEKHGYVIMDARSQMAAMGNAMIGKGTENPNNYKGAHIVFNCIENIHALRTSYMKLVRVALDQEFDGDFYGAIADSGWVQHVKAVLRASVRLAETLDIEGISVLTHCSDGWDRTAQMCALAQLMCDPYFRTLDGFAVLVEKEWCAFGHKFKHRCRRPTSDQEFSPVFLLFLDCVRQLMLQFPTAFEFNEDFLLYLADATQSDETATFLANTQQYRLALELPQLTASVWSMRKRPQYLNSQFSQACQQRQNQSISNPLSNPSGLNGHADIGCDRGQKPLPGGTSTITPSLNGKQIKFWTQYFFRHDASYLGL
mmetsp:Transcript_4029/g.8653  ORF Transcript_4029/g.8653 Transcript_4029/m.8653 type:complete len:609 (+) Transcript_4029:134-1960(+)